MVHEPSREQLTFEGVAARAEVNVYSVEYFFDSIKQLVAEAQLANYAAIVSEHHFVMTKVEAALAKEDLKVSSPPSKQNLDLGVGFRTDRQSLGDHEAAPRHLGRPLCPEPLL